MTSSPAPLRSHLPTELACMPAAIVGTVKNVQYRNGAAVSVDLTTLVGKRGSSFICLMCERRYELDLDLSFCVWVESTWVCLACGNWTCLGPILSASKAWLRSVLSVWVEPDLGLSCLVCVNWVYILSVLSVWVLSDLDLSSLCDLTVT
jgi:hypothetical protein